MRKTKSNNVIAKQKITQSINVERHIYLNLFRYINCPFEKTFGAYLF